MTVPSSKYSTVFLVFILWTAGLGAAAQFAKIAIPFTLLRAAYPDTGPEFGLLLSMISFFGILFGMAAGMVTARLGYRNMLLFALILGAGVSFWQSSMPHFSAMLLSRLIEGISHLIIVVAAPTLIAQISTSKLRGAAMTLWSTFFGVTFAVTAWAAPPFIETYGLGNLFMAHGGFMLGVAVVLGLSLKPLQRQKTQPQPFSAGALIHQHIQAYRSPYIAAPAIGWFFYTLTFVALLAILPDYLPAENKATIMALLPLSSIITALIVVTVLLRYISAANIVTLGFILAVLAMVLLWAGLPKDIVFIALFAILGLVQGASFAAVPQLNTDAGQQAIANGAMAQMGNLGNTLGTPLMLLVLAKLGFTGLIVGICLCYIFGAAAHLWFSARRA